MVSHEMPWTVDAPSAERRVLDLEDDVLGVLNGRNGPLLDLDLERALEDDSLHCLGHVDRAANGSRTWNIYI
jgi:hypothetical protein